MKDGVKNPFIKKKATTIRRTADEVYSQKGLNELKLAPKTDIDKLFHNLEQTLIGDYATLTIELLYERLHLSSDNKRYAVVSKLFDILLDIQKFSEAQKFDDDSLIKISLHDVKTFSKLVNIIILQGVYPAISNFNIGIPFAKRTLNSFGKTNTKIETLPKSDNYSSNFKLLSLIYDKFYQVFQVKSDVKDLLLKGTGFTDFLVVSIALQTIPYFNNKKYIDEFPVIISLPDTYELFQLYTLLISTTSPTYFKSFVISQLQSLHYNAPRNDGLLTLIEFVLGLRENDDIDIEKFNQISNIILLKPKSINVINYFKSIGDQSYELLININRPTVTSCVGFVLENLWLKNPKIVQDFVLKKLWQVFNPTYNKTDEASLNNGINVLISLTKKIQNSDFMKAIIYPILLPLWGYYTFLSKREKSVEILTNILVSYFVVLSNSTDLDDNVYGLDTITKNLMFSGESWCFQFGPNGLTQIAEKDAVIEKKLEIQSFINDLDNHVKYFVELLKNIDEFIINKVFIQILKRWLNNNKSQQILDENPFFTLIDLRLLEGIGENFKEILARTPNNILELVDSLLVLKPEAATQSEDADSDDEDEFEEDTNIPALSIVMELLSAILTETVELDDTCLTLLKKIQKSLTRFTENPSDITKPAKSLYERITDKLNGDSTPNSFDEAQKQKLNRAITSLNDPLVPIRAHGLYLLRQLIETKSKVVNLEFVINLHLVQLKDPEPFVYLNVIKGLESLIDYDPEVVITLLCLIYTDENTDLDEKLRIGEVLLRFVQSSGETFSGKIAETVVNSTLEIIRKPLEERKDVEEEVGGRTDMEKEIKYIKPEIKDFKDEIKEIKEEASDSENKDTTNLKKSKQSEKYKPKTTSQKDDRLRMSAMSILGICCNTNPIGMYGKLRDALDCSIGILQLETEAEKSIMRTAAIVLIHDLIIGSSKLEVLPFPQEYQQKVYQLLTYINDTDNNILVREQAQVVLESIKQISSEAFELMNEEKDEYKIFRV